MSRFNFTQTFLEGVFTIEPKPIHDERGYFERYFCAQDFREIGILKPIAQMNHSKTIGKGSIRGIHYQTPPFCETKIVRCLKGAIYDVAVDLRADSSTFLQHFGIELSETNAKYLVIPDGFGHTFQTLSDEAEILYLVTEFFNPQAEGSLNALDPILNIKWPLKIGTMSSKDANAPSVNQVFKDICIGKTRC